LNYCVRLLIKAVSLTVLLSLEANSLAEEKLIRKAPVSAAGFEYRYIEKPRMHFNDCVVAACIQGSRVSYIFYSPNDRLSFSEFKSRQKSVVDLLNKRAVKGKRVEFGEVNSSSNELYKIYTSYRYSYQKNGKILVTLSTMVFTKVNTISLISSSYDKQTTEANWALFLSKLLILSGAKRVKKT